MLFLLPAAAYWDTVVVGYVSTYDALSDKVKYPTFARVSNTMTSLALATQAFINLQNWTHVAIVYVGGYVSAVVDGMTSAFKGNINIVYTYMFNSTTASDTEYDTVLSKIRMLTRGSVIQR